VARVRSRLALALGIALSAGCGRCASPSAHKADAAPPTPLLPAELLPPPASWTFAPVRTDLDVALPERCKGRAPLVRAPVAATTRFIAEAHTLGALVVADTADGPPRLTGAAWLKLDPAGASHDPAALPWIFPSAVPRLGRTAQGEWIAAFDRPGEAGASRVGLFRGGSADALGEGDAFEAVDLACAGDRCALLTSRRARVAPVGAAVWTGSPADPASAWREAEIVPAAAESEAHPFGLAGVEALPAGLAVTVALVDRGEIVLYRAGDGPPRETARIPAGHGVLDVLSLDRQTVAMVYGTPLDDAGCAKVAAAGGGAMIRFERPGLPGIEIRTPAPPLGGSLRRLGKGALATWIAPLGCNQPRRVLYAVVLDGDGVPQGAPMAVSDAMSFAVAAEGDDVDLWVHNEARVTWMRMTCTP
jgi:hypothetical protein